MSASNLSAPPRRIKSASAASERISADWRRQLVSNLDGPLRLAPVVLALVLIWVFFDVENSLFLSSRNLTNLANQTAVTSILGLGLMLVLIVRQIDLSLAALAAVCGIVAARFAVLEGWSVVPAIAIALAAGTVWGVVQGAITTYFKAPSFIVTLGGYFILTGLVLVLLPSTQSIALADTPMQDIASTTLPTVVSYVAVAILVAGFFAVRLSYVSDAKRLGLPVKHGTQLVAPTVALAILLLGVVVMFNSYQGVPVPTVIVAVLMTVLAYVGRHTSVGKHLYAVGGNPEAARRAGIPVAKLTVVAFAASGLLTAVGGLVEASRELGVSGQSVDLTLLFQAMSAAVIGGVSLFGGRGSVWGVLLGSLVIGSISNGLLLLNTSTQVIYIAEGGILVAAVVIDSIVAKNGPSRSRE